MSFRLNRRSRQEDNGVFGSPDPLNLQKPSSPTDLATDQRNNYSQNAARSLDHFGNALYIDTTDNRTDDCSELVSADSRFISDEISPLLLSPTPHMQTFTDNDILPLNLGSPLRTVISPESVGRHLANRVRTPRRQMTFRVPNARNRSHCDKVLDSKANLQTNPQGLTITGRTRRLSEQSFHSVEPPFAEHRRRRRRYYSGNAMSTAQQQQFRRLNEFHGGDNLLAVATQLGPQNSMRSERLRHFTGSSLLANRRPQNLVRNSENGLLMNLERATIGSGRRLPESLHSEQQPFPAETRRRRRRRHITGRPRSVGQEQQSMLLNEQYPHDDESEGHERRRHSLESHLPGSLQIVSLDQLLSSVNDSLADSVQPSEALLRQD